MKILLLLVLVIPQVSFGWGKTGHRVVGEIAESHLTDLAKLHLRKIMGHEKLPEASVWPDRIKSDPKLRSQYNHWHYLNALKGKNVSQRKVQPKGDILSAIDHYSKILKDSKSPKMDKLHAVRFLTHFIGDLHQPLHTGYPDDKGGNDILVKWFGKETTLHNVWDESMIQLEELSYTEYATKLNHPSKHDIKTWQATASIIWAQESRDYVQEVYKFEQKKYWEYDYTYQHLPFLNKRLLMAGVRLAGLFNQLLK